MKKFVLRKITFQCVLDGLDEFTAPIVKTDKNIKNLNKWAFNKGLTFKKNQNIFGGYFVDPITADCYCFNII